VKEKFKLLNKMYSIFDFTILIIVLILGFTTGSFLNICIYRIPKNESLFKNSLNCLNCGSRVKLLEKSTVISLILGRGKCNNCDMRYKLRDVLVELFTGVIFIILLVKYGFTVELIAYIYFACILIIVFFIDIDYKIIPNELVIAGLAGGTFLIIYNLFKPVKIYGDRTWWNPVLGALIGSGFLFLVAVLGILIYKSDQAMGMGDVKIFAPIGLFLGWKMTIVALILSIFAGGFISLILIVFRIKDRKSTIPFGPFIVISTLVTLMWGWDIVRWYLAAVI
jgi:leader peptidase (prepilin peptidase)/N-methyltransferase